MKKTILNLIRVFLIGAIGFAGFLSIITPAKAQSFNDGKVHNIGFNQNYENQDITVEGSGTILVLDGVHTFNNITVKNDGKITHNPVDKTGKVAYVDKFNARWSGVVTLDERWNDDYANYKIVIIGAESGSRICISTSACDGSNWVEYIEHDEADSYNYNDYPTLEVGQEYNVAIEYYYSGGAAAWFKLILVKESNSGIYEYDHAGLITFQHKVMRSGREYNEAGLNGEYYKDGTGYNFTGTPEARIDFEVERRYYLIDFDENDAVVSSTAIGGLNLTANTVTLDDGMIDVNGKGYLGGKGYSEGTGKGYGPGGGQDYYKDTAPSESLDGAGGGYGGRGGGSAHWDSANNSYLSYPDIGDFRGLNYPSDSGINIPTLPNQADLYGQSVPIIFGSGGAGGERDITGGNKIKSGFRGGGSVVIISNSITVQNGGGITANGTGYTSNPSSTTPHVGAGSGGLIYIKANIFSLPSGSPTVSKGGNSSMAEDGVVYYGNAIDQSHTGRLTANGGLGASRNINGINHYTGDGGGGWVVLDFKTAPKISKMVEVTVWWMEGERREEVKLKTILRDVSPQ